MSAPSAPQDVVAPRWLRALRALSDRKMLAMLLLSLAAGIPYGAVLGTLNAWLTAEGVTPSEVGVLGFIILAYSYKFIWAPAFQGARVPDWAPGLARRLGPRRAWLITLQVIIAILLGLLALSDPSEAIGQLALIGVAVAFASATHDIVLEAWRIEIATGEEDKDLMSALYQFGYRFAGLFTGMFALILADHVPWSIIYIIIAAGMALASLGTLIAPEPDHAREQVNGRDVRPSYAPGLDAATIRGAVGVVGAGWAVAIGLIVLFAARSFGAAEPPSASVFTREQGPLIVFLSVVAPGLVAAFLLRRGHAPAPYAPPSGGLIDKAAGGLFHTVIDPLMDIVQRLKWPVILVMALVLSYRFVDLIWGGFAYPFYLGDPADVRGALGHSNADVAIASKTVGVFMTIAGAALGGAALIFAGRLPCLVLGAFASAVTNLLFADLAAGGGGMDAFLRISGLGGLLGAMGFDAGLARLTVAVGGENLAGGFASVAFVAYLTSIVNPRFAAVQYALLASLTMMIGSLGRAGMGEYIDRAGYHDFFVLTAWLGLVAVALSLAEWVRQALTARPQPDGQASAQPLAP